MNETYISKVLAEYDRLYADVSCEKNAKFIYEAIATFFSDNSLQDVSSTELSMESLTHGNPKINTNQLEAVGIDKFSDLFTKLDIPKDLHRDAISAITVELAKYAGGSVNRHFTDSLSSEAYSINNLYSSSFASANFISGAKAHSLAMEAFGVTGNNLALDAKLAVTIAILAFRRSIATRGYAFKTVTSDTVLFRSERYEVFDLNTIGAVSGNKEYKFLPFIELYEDPTMASPRPKRIIVLKANDDVSDPRLLADELIMVGKPVSMFNLSKLANTITHSTYDYSDTVNDGARLDAVVVSATDGTDTEQFLVSLKNKQDALFVLGTNAVDSIDRVLHSSFISTLDKDSETINGTASSLLGALDADHFISFTINANGTLNLQSSIVNVNGSLQKEVKRIDGGTPTAGVVTAVNALTFTVIGYKMKADYSEENIRKSAISMQTAHRQFSYAVPASKSIIVQYSIEETVEQSVIKGVDEMIRLGVDERTAYGTLDVLDEVYERLTDEKKNPTAYGRGKKVMDDYAAGYIARPTVRKSPYNSTAKTKTRESSKGYADKRTEFDNFLLGVTTDLKARSFFDKQLDAAEKPTWTVITSPYILSALLAIPYVHTAMANEDKKTINTGEMDATYVLPNGDMLNIITTTFEVYKNKIAIFPVRKNRDNDVLGFATVVNKGTFAGNVPFTAGNGSSNKYVANIRQIMIPTNPVGAVIEISGLDEAFFQ